MKAYIQLHESHAGKWIYQGFALAFSELGYEVVFYRNLEDISDFNYELMAVDGQIRKSGLRAVQRAHRAYIFAQPQSFPMPWGAHPNFRCMCPPDVIEELNKMDNVYLWNWGDIDEQTKNENFPLWKQIHSVPLAFDSVSYKDLEDEKYAYDVCYVGGWANNGYDEKRKIMIKHFGHLMKTDLNCGIFINKDLTHTQENKILHNSKVSLNIHDAYQRELGNDTNERTFKGLGLTGVLVSDNIGQIERMFPEVPLFDSPVKMVEIIKEYVNKPLEDIKAANRKLIRENHSYINRVEQLRALKNEGDLH